MIGELSALTAATLWASGSFLFTEASMKIGTIQLNIDRMALATFLLFLTLLIFQIPLGVSTSQYFLLMASGFIGLVIGDTALFRAFKEIGPRIALVLYSINPAMAAILAYFLLGENLSVLTLVGILITIAGIGLVVSDSNSDNNSKSRFKVTKFGIILGIIAALGQASGLIIAKKALMLGDIHSMSATFLRISSAVMIMLPISLIMRRYKNPIKLYSTDKSSLKIILIGSVIGPYLGISLSFIALMNTNVGIASTLLSTVPIIMLPMNYVVYKEKLSWRAVLGAVIACGGVSLLFI